MPNIITHALFGYAPANLLTQQLEKKYRRTYRVLITTLPIIPDLDTFFMKLVPTVHRGLSHSLFFAGLIALLTVFLFPNLRRAFPGKGGGLFLVLFGILALHGVLDTLTYFGDGVGFFMPFYNHRYASPIAPIPAAPIATSISAILNSWTQILNCFADEILFLWPIAAGLIFYTFKRIRYHQIISAILVLICIASWIIYA